MTKRKKIFVTGGNGFIGSCLVKKLIDMGEEPVCLILPGENSEEIKNFGAKIVFGDITDKKTLYPALEDVSIIYHLAASLGSKDPDILNLINVEGTKNLIDVAIELKLPIEKFLMTSSVAAAGPVKKGEIQNEYRKPDPVSDYGKSKLKAEQYLISKKTLIPFTIIRFPLVYGPRSDGGLFTAFKLLSRHLELKFPEMETNIAYVEDIADGMIEAVLSKKTVGEVFTIGEDHVYSTREIVEKMKDVLDIWTITIPVSTSLLYFFCFIFESFAKITGKDPILRKKNLDEYFKYRYWGYSIKKAADYFGYKSKVSFDEGIKRTFDWYRKNGIVR